MFLMLILGVFLMLHFWGNPRQQPVEQNVLDKPVVKQEVSADGNEANPAAADTAANVKETDVPPQYFTLGSLDPKDRYKMLITLTNQGAAVERIELNTPQYRDVHEQSGYLGQIIADVKTAEYGQDGATVQVVGKGTPAEQFGLQVGDKIIEFNRLIKKTQTYETSRIKTFADLRNNLRKTKPKDEIALTLIRNGQKIDGLKFVLSYYPMDVIRPESVVKDYNDYTNLGGLHGASLPGQIPDANPSDQLSFLTTLQRIDDRQLDLPASLAANNSKLRDIIPRDNTLDIELPKVELRTKNWKIEKQTENEIVFSKTVPQYGIEFVKTYKLSEKYDLTFKIEVRNLDTKPHTVAYQLDGPTGLPLEGGWYSTKPGPGWGRYGVRDIVVNYKGGKTQTVANSVVASDMVKTPWADDPLNFVGVDSTFFQCTFKPDKEKNAVWHKQAFPIRVGEKNYDWSVLTDVSFRLLSKEQTLQPNEKMEHSYTVFAGPKDTKVLSQYGLDDTIAYGWFWFCSKPLLWLLHTFHSFGLSYALAIVLLTICVRLLMFPMSRKQALGAIKMQEIQPELKAIAEKYKDDMQARAKAQGDVFKKHNYHPASGCLPLFIQLPIFIGLYKALQIDSGLYGTPLISSSFRWCSDLSAPDMLIDWSSFWTSIGWTSFNTGTGTGFLAMFALGPYFNLLPLLTIALFLVQQAVMMPPPTDDQSRMQRTMMQYMMIFMGFMFFKVPSGLCVYFIISTLWGLAERRFIPKAALAGAMPKAANSTYDVEPVSPNTSGAKKKDKRQKEPAAPSGKEGFFTRMMRQVKEITDKAAEDQRFEKSKKDRKRK